MNPILDKSALIGIASFGAILFLVNFPQFILPFGAAALTYVILYYIQKTGFTASMEKTGSIMKKMIKVTLKGIGHILLWTIYIGLLVWLCITFGILGFIAWLLLSLVIVIGGRSLLDASPQ